MINVHEFASCLKPQFILQKPKNTPGISKGDYFIAYNSEILSAGVVSTPTEKLAMLVFCYLAPMYGISDNDIAREIKVAPSEVIKLKDLCIQINKPDFEDQAFRKLFYIKTGLVKNCVFNNYRVQITLFL